MKAFTLCFTLFVCNSLTLGSGAVFNPAFGFAQSMYMIGVNNRDGSGTGTEQAKVIWVYMIVPYFGAAASALFYFLHGYIESGK